MANEITLTARLSASKGGGSVANSLYSFSVDMAGSNMYHSMQEIDGDTPTEAAKALDLGDVNTANDYWLLVRNMDATYDVLLALDSTHTTFAKQFAVIPPRKAVGPICIPGGATVYARNSSALTEVTSDIEVVACEA